MGVRFFSASIFVSGGVAPNFAQGTLVYGRLPIALDPAFVITKGAGETPPLPPPPLATVAIATPVPTASATTTFLPVVVVQDDDDFNDDDVEGGASQSSRLLW